MALGRGGLARAGSHDEHISLAEHDQHGACLHQRAPALDDQLEHPGELGVADRIGDVAGGLEAQQRPLGLFAATLALLVQPGILDRRAGPLREHDGRLLVLVSELLRTLFLSEV